jgi:ABC-2 type transport system permease protein
VFYPLSVLPSQVQIFAWFMPVTHVFEGMRSVLSHNGFSVADFWWAFALNIVYLFLASLFYAHMFRRVKELGLISKVE